MSSRKIGDGDHLKLLILRYLLDREHDPGASIPDSDEIAHKLDIPSEDVLDQLEILESRGAVDAGLTLAGATPMLTGSGKALLEELEEGVSMSDKAPVGSGESPSASSTLIGKAPRVSDGGIKDPSSRALEILERVESDLLGPHDIVACFRRCLIAVRLLGWTADEDWIRKELSGYPSDQVPSLRMVPAVLMWTGEQLGDAIKLSAHASVSPNPELADRPVLSALRVSAAQAVRGKEGGFADRTGNQKDVSIIGKTLRVFEVQSIPSTSVALAIDRITEFLFDFVSRAIISLRSGEAATSIFLMYKSSADQKMASLGIDDHLKTAYLNLSQSNPTSWQAAVLACRNIIHQLSEKLWQASETEYPDLLDPDGKPISLARDKELNRIRAYLHFNGALRKGDKLLRAQLEWLSVMNTALYSEASSAKHSVTFEDAQSIVINIYVVLGEIARHTGFEPVKGLSAR